MTQYFPYASGKSIPDLRSSLADRYDEDWVRVGRPSATIASPRSNIGTSLGTIRSNFADRSLADSYERMHLATHGHSSYEIDWSSPSSVERRSRSIPQGPPQTLSAPGSSTNLLGSLPRGSSTNLLGSLPYRSRTSSGLSESASSPVFAKAQPPQYHVRVQPPQDEDRYANFLEANVRHVLEPVVQEIFREKPRDPFGHALLILDSESKTLQHLGVASGERLCCTTLEYKALVQPMLTALAMAALDNASSPHSVVSTLIKWLKENLQQNQKQHSVRHMEEELDLQAQGAIKERRKLVRTKRRASQLTEEIEELRERLSVELTGGEFQDQSRHLAEKEVRQSVHEHEENAAEASDAELLQLQRELERAQSQKSEGQRKHRESAAALQQEILKLEQQLLLQKGDADISLQKELEQLRSRSTEEVREGWVSLAAAQKTVLKLQEQVKEQQEIAQKRKYSAVKAKEESRHIAQELTEKQAELEKLENEAENSVQRMKSMEDNMDVLRGELRRAKQEHNGAGASSEAEQVRQAKEELLAEKANSARLLDELQKVRASQNMVKTLQLPNTNSVRGRGQTDPGSLRSREGNGRGKEKRVTLPESETESEDQESQDLTRYRASYRLSSGAAAQAAAATEAAVKRRERKMTTASSILSRMSMASSVTNGSLDDDEVEDQEDDDGERADDQRNSQYSVSVNLLSAR